jgi:hypothetical protein
MSMVRPAVWIRRVTVTSSGEGVGSTRGMVVDYDDRCRVLPDGIPYTSSTRVYFAFRLPMWSVTSSIIRLRVFSIVP